MPLQVNVQVETSSQVPSDVDHSSATAVGVLRKYLALGTGTPAEADAAITIARTGWNRKEVVVDSGPAPPKRDVISRACFELADFVAGRNGREAVPGGPAAPGGRGPAVEKPSWAALGLPTRNVFVGVAASNDSNDSNGGGGGGGGDGDGDGVGGGSAAAVAAAVASLPTSMAECAGIGVGIDLQLSVPRDGAIRARVGSISLGGAAAEAGLAAGDILVALDGQVLLDMPEPLLLSTLCSAWLAGNGLNLVVMPSMVAVLMCNPWPSTQTDSSSGVGGASSSSTPPSGDSDASDGDDSEYDSDGYLRADDPNQACVPRAAVAFFKLEDSSSLSERSTQKKRSFITLTGLFGSSEGEERAAFRELLKIEGLQKQRTVVLSRLLELVTAFRDDRADENVALGWLTTIRPILITEFGADAIDAHKEYVYELLSGFSNDFQKEEALRREGAPSKGEREILRPSINASLDAAQSAWMDEKLRSRGRSGGGGADGDGGEGGPDGEGDAAASDRNGGEGTAGAAGGSGNKLSFFMRLASKLDSPSQHSSGTTSPSPTEDAALAKSIANAEDALRSPKPSVYEQLNGAGASSRGMTLSAAQAAWDAEKKRRRQGDITQANTQANAGASGSVGAGGWDGLGEGTGTDPLRVGGGFNGDGSSSASTGAPASGEEGQGNSSGRIGNAEAAEATLVAAQEAWAAEKQRLRAVDQGGPTRSAAVRSLQFSRQAGGRVSKAKQVATPIIFE